MKNNSTSAGNLAGSVDQPSSTFTATIYISWKILFTFLYRKLIKRHSYFVIELNKNKANLSDK